MYKHKIEKNYMSTIILFEVNAEVSRHCLNYITYIYALRSKRKDLFIVGGFT